MISATEFCWAVAGAGSMAKPATAAALAARVVVSLVIVETSFLSQTQAGETRVRFLICALKARLPPCNRHGSPRSAVGRPGRSPLPPPAQYRDVPIPRHGTG